MSLSKQPLCIPSNTWTNFISFVVLFFVYAYGFSFTTISHASDHQPLTNTITLQFVLEQTLTLNPNVKLQEQQREITRGQLFQEEGVFDPNLQITSSYDHDKTPINTFTEQALGDPLEYSKEFDQTISLQTLTPYGVTFGPNISLSKLKNNTDHKTSATLADLNFSLNIKLLKGFGKAGTSAGKMAAEKNLLASEYNLYHTISQQVLTSCQAFWGYCSAIEELKIYNEAEKKAKKQLDDVKIMVARDAVSASELYQLEANLASKTALIYQQTQTLLEYKQNLAIAIGLPENRLDSIAPPSDTTFSDGIAFSIANLPRKKIFIQTADKNRYDLKEYKIMEQSNQILLEGTKNGLLPELNLNTKIGYKGLDEGDGFKNYVSSVGNKTQWPNWEVALGFSYPIGNKTGRGEVLSQQSLYRQSEIQTNDLVRNIHSNVTVSFNGLVSAMRVLERSQHSADMYRTAVKNEELRYKMGVTTTLDILNMEDNFRSSQLQVIEAKLSLMNAMASLRFETGSIISINNKSASINIKGLTSLDE